MRYARAQRRKEAAFALEQMSSIKDHHRAALEDVAVDLAINLMKSPVGDSIA